MFLVNDRSTSPYREIAFIQSIFPDGTVARGSGTVVGNNDVLTALHVIYDDRYGGKAVSVTVTPGAYINSTSFSAPLGTYAAHSWSGYSSNWDKNGDHVPSYEEVGHDLALISLDTNIGATTGILGISTTGSDLTGTVLGYPVRGTGLMQDTAAASYVADYPLYFVGTGLGSGASGGPLLDGSGATASIRGVLSAGDNANTFSLYAALTGANAAWVAKASTANDGLLDASSAYRPSGLGVASGSDADDILIQARLSYDTTGTAQVYGYRGADALIMRGSSWSYQLTTATDDPSLLQVKDNVSGQTLNLHDVNALDFSDKTVFVMTENQAQLARLYTVFDRVPDLAGLAYWTDLQAHGMSFTDISRSFANSAEFIAHYGTSTNSQFASLLYERVLDRAGDGDGLNYWTTLMDQGMNRLDVMTHFTNSPESERLTEGSAGYIKIIDQVAWTNADVVIQKGVAFGSSYGDSLLQSEMVADSGHTMRVFGGQGNDVLSLQGTVADFGRTATAPSTLVLTANNGSVALEVHDVNVLRFQDRDIFVLDQQEAQIARLYTAFDRVPEYQGIEYWMHQHALGRSFDDIASNFTASPEFAAWYGSQDNVGFTNTLYRTVLGREGEASGLSYWATQLEHGMSRANVMLHFTESPENQQLTEGGSGFIQLVGQTDWA